MKTEVKKGDLVVLKSLAQVVKELDVNEHNEFVCENVDVHIKYFGDVTEKSCDWEVPLEVREVDDEGDFSFGVYSAGIFFGNEMIREVVYSPGVKDVPSI